MFGGVKFLPLTGMLRCEEQVILGVSVCRDAREELHPLATIDKHNFKE